VGWPSREARWFRLAGHRGTAHRTWPGLPVSGHRERELTAGIHFGQGLKRNTGEPTRQSRAQIPSFVDSAFWERGIASIPRTLAAAPTLGPAHKPNLPLLKGPRGMGGPRSVFLQNVCGARHLPIFKRGRIVFYGTAGLWGKSKESLHIPDTQHGDPSRLNYGPFRPTF